MAGESEYRKVLRERTEAAEILAHKEDYGAPMVRWAKAALVRPLPTDKIAAKVAKPAKDSRKGTWWEGRNYYINGEPAGRVVYFSKNPGITAQWCATGQPGWHDWKSKVFPDKTPVVEIKQFVKSMADGLASAKDAVNLPGGRLSNVCMNCKGTGKAWYAGRQLDCRMCDGTGKTKWSYTVHDSRSTRLHRALDAVLDRS